MSAFLQVVSFAVLIVAALVVGGVVPLGAFTKFLPTHLIKGSPLPMRTGDISEGAGGGPAGQGGGAAVGYGAIGTQGPAEPEPKRPGSREAERARAERSEQRVASRPGCDSPTRLDALAARHDAWNRNDLALIACRQVREGFSEEQLVAARGRPLRRMSPDTASGMEVWVYRDMRVVLERDQIVSIRQ